MNFNFIKWELQGIKSSITAIVVTISLFFAGIVYGDTPIEMKITYDIPSQVYEYQVGDEVEIRITEENVGRPFKAKIDDDYGFDTVKLYSSENKSEIYAISSDSDISIDAFHYEYVKKGEKRETIIKVRIPEWADKGEYSLSVRLNFEAVDCEISNDMVVFENVIIVK